MEKIYPSRASNIVKLYFNSFPLLILILFLGVGCKSNSKSNEFTPGSPQYEGQDIFVRMACNACHSVDGTLKLGPTMQNQYGKEILHTDGSIMIINDDYIRESLLYPLKHIAEGYTPIMPSYKPVLSDEDVANLIAYIKALK